MAFNTRCPACTTVFSVPPSALSASGGWVRCGRCSEVFDASAHQDDGLNTEFNEVADRLSRQMQIPLTPDEQADLALRPRRDGRAPALTPSSAAAVKSVGSRLPPDGSSKKTRREIKGIKDIKDLAKEANAPLPIEPLGPPATPVRKSAEANKDLFKTQEPVDRPSTVERRRKEDPQEATVSRLDRRRSGRTRSRSDGTSRLDEPLSSQSALSLDEDASVSVFPGHYQGAQTPGAPSVFPITASVWTGIAIVLLGLVLALQVVWTQRNELATYYPSLKPSLDFICARLQCKLMPLRQLDMVSIDNSVFRMLTPSDAGDSYQLSWVVTNQALVPVAAPALELTLQDVLDRPLLRKVIQPADVGSPDLAIAPEGKWQGSMTVVVHRPEGGLKVSGYRLIAFYP